MPKSTEDRQARRRRDAVQSAVAGTLLNLFTAGLLFWLWLSAERGGLLSKLLLLCIVLDLGSILPIWINFRVRLKEIQGGEEDAASQY